MPLGKVPTPVDGQPPGRADVVIVGNGALGLFLADELMRRQFGSVTVVGPWAREGGASQAAGAMLGCFGEVTRETLRNRPQRSRFEMAFAAHERWEDVVGGLEDDAPGRLPLRTADETHVILNAVGAELDSINFEAMLAALDEYKQPWEEVDPRTIPGYRPRTESRALRAVRLPTEGAVDARAVLNAVQERLLREGVTLVDATVRRLTEGSDAVTGVELDDGRLIEAGTVVVAAGAASEQLVQPFLDGALMPTFPGLGFAMLSRRVVGEPFRSVVRTPNRGFACGLHVVPAGPGMEYLGATNRLVDRPTDVVPVGDVRFLAQYAMQQLDEDIARHDVVRYLTGNRPMTLDGFPLIGALPVPGLYLMTGTYRDGFHCAPLLATHVANELQGRPGVIDPMFAPVRRPIETRTLEYSVEEYVEHTLAAWFETGAQAAPQMTTAQLANSYRLHATQVYERLGIDYGLAPDVLWYAAGSLTGARRIARYLRRGEALTGAAHPPATAGATSGEPGIARTTEAREGER
ncbi:FAD-dependent oxidoreductase [Streptomyces sp. CB03238]|uniref:NAD(P)/FAD-dependent oxidoreductase n=1 Tax=Streptomyces sp. CB03238 TaxID=1907777 RepID=UPI000A109E16|nr:FAD-dependent oxidoreductase [Streptomyces sp. CB03238]ORT60865.1 hypothetical protein BKD26_06590 [Streptomyces sp. CB03238]